MACQAIFYQGTAKMSVREILKEASSAGIYKEFEVVQALTIINELKKRGDRADAIFFLKQEELKHIELAQEIEEKIPEEAIPVLISFSPENGVFAISIGYVLQETSFGMFFCF